MATINDRDCERLALSAEERRVHQQSLLVDLHVDCLLLQRLFGYDVTASHAPGGRIRWTSLKYDLMRKVAELRGNHEPFFNHADVPRMIRGGYSCAGLGLHAWPWQRGGAWREIQKQLECFHELVLRDPRLIQARGPDDVRRAAAEDKLAVFAAVEGLHCLGGGGRSSQTRRIDRIEQLFAAGVRYATFTHLGPNDAARHSYGPLGNQTDGLSAFGRDVVRKMNEVGMIVDVAHVNHPGTMQICEVSTKPVIASHSGLAGVHPERRDRGVKRLLQDEALLAIAATGGVVGLMFAPYFLSGHDDDLGSVVRHLRHGIDLLDKTLADGSRHFAVGSDFDGWISSIPQDVRDAADMPLLTATLLRHGFDERQIHGVLGQNFLQVWARVLA